MKTQNQVKRNLSQPDVIEDIKQILNVNSRLSRTQLAKTLCQKYAFYDARGKPQLSSCLKALRELECHELLSLPAPQKKNQGQATPRRLEEAVPEAQEVPAEVTAIKDLRLVRVQGEAQMRIWNELMIREHPQGHRPLVGRQLRYLIESEHGWLGAIGFAAAALHLKDRDHWIGWDWEIRRSYLDRVVGLSRFLIRNEVHCQNLASRVLAMCIREMTTDFEKMYGYQPWLLESFVDTSCFSGTCYRAANWLRVGQTQGRGRQDRKLERRETVKDIYVYVLDDNFRQKMGLPEGAGLTPLRPETGLDDNCWAENEFGDAPIGDNRLSNRLVDIAQTKGQSPGASWLAACQGDKAAAKGYYRFIEHPDDEAMKMENILKPHRERTIRRMEGQRTVLCVQDTTSMNYSELKQCEGLGVVGMNKSSTISKGLRLHSTLSLTGDGLPLGILRAQCYAPELKPERKGKDCRNIPIEEKETFRWIEGMRDCMEVISDMPNTSCVVVMDREGDFFELFDAQRQNPCVDILVRAQHDRHTGEDLSLFEMVGQSPVKFRLRIDIPRRRKRKKNGRRPARAQQGTRQAEVAVRYTPAKINPPSWGVSSKKKPVLLGDAVILLGRLGGYLGRGKDPPPGHEVIWKGYSQLQTMCMGFSLARK